MLAFARIAATAVAAVAVSLAAYGEAAAQTKKIRYALGDVLAIESLGLLIALDRAKKRGVEVEITSFKSEDLATQAVVNGQADIGQGTPYAVVQKVATPIRLFAQLQTLQFYPVVAADTYKTWKDLNGQDVVVHSRGSGTEAIMNLMAQREGIKFKSVSFVPGSEVRATAMLKGTIKASIVDNTNKNLLMREAPGKFLVLPLGDVKASDEALFATKAFLDANKDAVGVLVEEIVRTWRAINANPQMVADERKKLNLLPDLPAKLEGDIVPYYQQAVQNGIFPRSGGGEDAVKNDFDFYTLAGQIQGSAKDLKLEDFWYLAPLKAALGKVGS